MLNMLGERGAVHAFCGSKWEVSMTDSRSAIVPVQVVGMEIELHSTVTRNNAATCSSIICICDYSEVGDCKLLNSFSNRLPSKRMSYLIRL
jgi:hypothetical protein